MNRALMTIGMLLANHLVFAATNSVPANPLPGVNRNDCFLLRFAKERRVLDNKRLVVWANGQSPYLVELDRPLQYLDSGRHSIAFVDGDGDGRVCRSLRDAIFVQDALLPKQRTVVGVTSLAADQIETLEQQYNTSLARKRRGQWGSDYSPPAPAHTESTTPKTK